MLLSPGRREQCQVQERGEADKDMNTSVLYVYHPRSACTIGEIWTPVSYNGIVPAVSVSVVAYGSLLVCASPALVMWPLV
jgi:hypothetical protein